MKKLLILALSLIPTSLQAQTYTQLQWGVNKGVNPYQFGANINGTWSNLGTVSSTGVWSIPGSVISGVALLASPNTFTAANTFTSTIRQPNSTFYAASQSKPTAIQKFFSTLYDSGAPMVVAAPGTSQNGIVGATYQNNSSSLSYPVGVTG